jgi:hypothetical protein
MWLRTALFSWPVNKKIIFTFKFDYTEIDHEKVAIQRMHSYLETRQVRGRLENNEAQ